MPESALHPIPRIGPGEPIADVIFVHGLSGHPFETWQHDRTRPRDSWPYWLAQAVPEVAVWTLGYDAAWHQWFGRAAMPLPFRARDVLAELVSHDIGRAPIGFVCHSLGGLLVKKVLENAVTLHNPQWEPIAEQTRAVVFVGTPHAGADLASLLARLGCVLGASPAIEDLRAHDSNIMQLNTWYRENAARLRVRTLCYFETRQTKMKRLGFLPWGGVRVVAYGDADPGIVGTIPSPLDGDHFAICRPIRHDTRLPLEVAKLVREVVANPFNGLGPEARTSDALPLPPDPSLVRDLDERQAKRLAGSIRPRKAESIRPRKRAPAAERPGSGNTTEPRPLPLDAPEFDGAKGRIEKARRIAPHSASGSWMSEDELALYPITHKASDDNTATVFFVHGVSGHPFLSWQHRETSTYSLLQWLDEDMPDVNVYTIGYPSALSKWLGHSNDLVQTASSLLVLLEGFLNRKRTVFVCHGEGGLLLKQALYIAGHNDLWKSFLNTVSEIIFLDTPQRGSKVADIFSSIIMSPFFRPSPLLKDLKSSNDNLRIVDSWFKKYVSESDIKVHIFYSTRPTQGFKIVSYEEVNLGLPQITPRPLDSDHINIGKPRSKDSILYQYIIKIVRDLVDEKVA